MKTEDPWNPWNIQVLSRYDTSIIKHHRISNRIQYHVPALLIYITNPGGKTQIFNEKKQPQTTWRSRVQNLDLKLFHHGSPWPWCVQLDTTLPPSQPWKQRRLRTHREGNRSQSPAPDVPLLWSFGWCFIVWLTFFGGSEPKKWGALRILGIGFFLDLKMLKKIWIFSDFPYQSPYQTNQLGPQRTIFHPRVDRKNMEKPENLVGFGGSDRRCSSSRAYPLQIDPEKSLLGLDPWNSSTCDHFKCWAPYQRENNVATF